MRQLNMYATLLKVFHHLIDEVAERQTPDVLTDAVRRSGHDPAALWPSGPGWNLQRFSRG